MTTTSTKIVQPLANGQITIPIAIRRALGIDESSLLHVALQGDKIVITKLAVDLSRDSSTYTDDELAEILEADKVSPELAEWARKRFAGRML